ncbi:DUF1493 family protein [Paraburkholderia antibiotica]|uniref:DUF1493 family protein n=1 Tax=Paraburkholderia antibiotica TaxID=2728839 RepID=A0A7Y0A085_9BURK|nr:DUF1493 family protein [Paraburkholderia antibiotica]NML34091.1 DUF1493 family protein [Paraburkholderia antibiotica]
MTSRTWADLEKFIREETGISDRKPVERNLDVVFDLGQEGDEADEFMGKFFERFEIEVGDYDFGLYFMMEGEGLLYHLFRKFIRRKPHTFRREVLTVGMLYNVILKGKWECDAISEGKYS